MLSSFEQRLHLDRVDSSEPRILRVLSSFSSIISVAPVFRVAPVFDIDININTVLEI